ARRAVRERSRAGAGRHAVRHVAPASHPARPGHRARAARGQEPALQAQRGRVRVLLAARVPGLEVGAVAGRPRASRRALRRAMFEALVITLREGVEAALVLAIASGILRRQGREGQVGPLLAGAGLALVASVGLAVAATRITYNEEVVEGVGML